MIVAGIVVVLWVAALFLWAKPITEYGKWARALLAANGAGWLLGLAVAEVPGHPPPVVVFVVLFWPLNLLLLPAASVILWVCRRDAEGGAYLTVAAAYVVVNVFLLYVVPLGWMYLG